MSYSLDTQRVLIVNEGYGDNLGDQAIRESIEEIFRNLNYEVDFSHFSNPDTIFQAHTYEPQLIKNEKSDLKKRIINLRLKFKRNFLIRSFLFFRNYVKIIGWFYKYDRKIRQRIKGGNYRYVIIGGGQLLNTAYRASPNKFSIINYSWSRNAKRIKGTDLCYVGIGIAGSFNKFEKHCYRRSLKNAKKIWVRDYFSFRALDDLFGLKGEIIPDVVFYKNKKSPDSKGNNALVGVYSFHEFKVKFKKENITRKEYYAVWVNKIREYLSQSLEVSLFYTTQSDATETRLFQKYLKEEEDLEVSIVRTYTLMDLRRAYENTKIVYSGRMHGLILAMNEGCRVEAYITSSKLEAFKAEYIESDRTVADLGDEVFESLSEFFFTK